MLKGVSMGGASGRKGGELVHSSAICQPFSKPLYTLCLHQSNYHVSDLAYVDKSARLRLFWKHGERANFEYIMIKNGMNVLAHLMIYGQS